MTSVSKVLLRVNPKNDILETLICLFVLTKFNIIAVEKICFSCLINHNNLSLSLSM